MNRRDLLRLNAFVYCTSVFMPAILTAEETIDSRVQAFLDRYRWRDMNVPASDGQAMYDIIFDHGFTRALEIGTSTGHSGIWIAWALSKTGGKLTTLEIDESRHREAKANFEETGVSPYIDARLGDAHIITKELEGPFDFVFSDADKDWYTNYLNILLPKLDVGGCFVTHNVSEPVSSTRGFGRGRGRAGMGQNSDYVEYLLSVPNLDTSFIMSGGGMSVSYKTTDE